MLMKESEDLAAYRITTEMYRQEGEIIVSSSTANSGSESSKIKKRRDKGKGKEGGKKKKGAKGKGDTYCNQKGKGFASKC